MHTRRQCSSPSGCGEWNGQDGTYSVFFARSRGNDCYEVHVLVCHVVCDVSTVVL